MPLSFPTYSSRFTTQASLTSIINQQRLPTHRIQPSPGPLPLYLTDLLYFTNLLYFKLHSISKPWHPPSLLFSVNPTKPSPSERAARRRGSLLASQTIVASQTTAAPKTTVTSQTTVASRTTVALVLAEDLLPPMAL